MARELFRIAANGPQVGGRFNAANLLLWAGLPLLKPLVNAGKLKKLHNYLVHSELCPYIWAISEQQTP